jgi:LEA14-like dessication related protein
MLLDNDPKEMDLILKLNDCRKMWLAGLACLLMLGMTGCKVYRQFASPDLKAVTVQKVEVKLVEQSAEAAKFDVILTLANPNTTPLPLVKADLSLNVTGHGSGSTEYLLHRTVPANGTQIVTVPVLIVTTQQVTAGTAYATKGTATYEPPGEIRKLMTDSNVPLPAATFDAQGQF